MLLWLVLVAAALAALVCAIVPVGPTWLGDAGAVAVVSAYSWALAARTGGRPVIVGSVAVAIGVAVVLSEEDYLHTGAAVMTCVVSSVFAVMATVPAVTFTRAVRECLVALLIAGVGALATVGFEPAIEVVRFEYVTFGIALVGAFLLVYRLGAGLHGLGRRGVVIVVVGSVVLAGTLLYAELLRRYGSSGVDSSLKDVVGWSKTHLGASPRPLAALLGVPALVYGCHMRARRRQGWWLCAFGVAATSAVSNALILPKTPMLESGLAVLYGLVVGVVIGFLLIRLDLALSGTKGTRGRRSRSAEEASALRPEPRRVEPLL